MLLANFKIRISCPWSSTLRDKGIRSQILQCVPRYDAPGTSVLAVFITSESRLFELKSLLLESPGVEEVALRRTSRENVMLALIKTKRCACFSAGIPFKHVVRIKEEEKGLDVTCIFRDANDFRDFVSESTIKGYKVEVKKLVQFDVPSIMPSLTLTKKQEQLLSAALELGYYDIPRKVDTRELASIFGISPRAVSEMFRRIHKKLAETYLRKDVLTL
jgi:hypothetical protein